MDEKMIERIKQFLMAEDGMLIDIEPKYAELLAKEFVTNGYGHIPTAIKEVQEQITAMLTEYGNEEHELFEQADGEWKSYHCGNLDAIGAISDMLYDLFDEILEEYTAHDD